MAIIRMPHEFSRRILDIAPKADTASIAALWARIYHYIENNGSQKGYISSCDSHCLQDAWNEYIQRKTNVHYMGFSLHFWHSRKNNISIKNMTFNPVPEKIYKSLLRHAPDMSAHQVCILWQILAEQAFAHKDKKKIVFSTREFPWMDVYVKKYMQDSLQERDIRIILQKNRQGVDFINMAIC